MTAHKLERAPRREDTSMLPERLADGKVAVDPTWGQVQPIELAPGVKTVGELELIEHLERGRPVVDTRLEEQHAAGTIPGAHWIRHDRILDRRGELDSDRPTVFFCNGPQCKATPDAISRLLGAGYPPESILYYRGGIHDWMTLGYPTTA